MKEREGKRERRVYIGIRIEANVLFSKKYDSTRGHKKKTILQKKRYEIKKKLNKLSNMA